MSKALSYKEAKTISEAFAIAGVGVSLQYLMMKRKPWMWHQVIDAAGDLVEAVEDFKKFIESDASDAT